MLLIIEHALGIAFIGLLGLALFDSVKGTLTILSGLVLLAVGYNLKLFIFILKRIHPPRRTAQKQAPLSLDRLHDLGFDDLESQIEEIARQRLPDKVLGGILGGQEDEIRKNVAIMINQGLLLRNLDFLKAVERSDRSAATFHLERVVSIALKHCKTRLTKTEGQGKLPPGLD